MYSHYQNVLGGKILPKLKKKLQFIKYKKVGLIDKHKWQCKLLISPN